MTWVGGNATRKLFRALAPLKRWRANVKATKRHVHAHRKRLRQVRDSRAAMNMAICMVGAQPCQDEAAYRLANGFKMPWRVVHESGFDPTRKP